jgi:oxalate decarboxylase
MKVPKSNREPIISSILSGPLSSFEGGTLQGAKQKVWALLCGRDGSVYLARLRPGGVREPHWHPNGWEFNYVISGTAKWSIVGPKAVCEHFAAGGGDLVFIPRGHFHYFENASETDDLVVLIAFNTSREEADDDIGLVASLSAVPADVLGAVFKTSSAAFANFPKHN